MSKNRSTDFLRFFPHRLISTYILKSRRGTFCSKLNSLATFPLNEKAPRNQRKNTATDWRNVEIKFYSTYPLQRTPATPCSYLEPSMRRTASNEFVDYISHRNALLTLCVSLQLFGKPCSLKCYYRTLGKPFGKV